MSQSKKAEAHSCEACGAEGAVVLHSKCHTESPTWAVLYGDTLTIECAKCGKMVTRFKVVIDS